MINVIPGKIKVEKIPTTPINNILWNSKYKKGVDTSIDKIHVLTTINYNKAEKQFGKLNGSFSGEVFYKVWHLSYKGYKFLLFADGPNTGMGSSMEFITDELDWYEIMSNKEIYDVVTEFRNEMYNLFKS